MKNKQDAEVVFIIPWATLPMLNLVRFPLEARKNSAATAQKLGRILTKKKRFIVTPLFPSPSLPLVPSPPAVTHYLVALFDCCAVSPRAHQPPKESDSNTVRHLTRTSIRGGELTTLNSPPHKVVVLFVIAIGGMVDGRLLTGRPRYRHRAPSQ
jgi:hypothetical protein